MMTCAWPTGFDGLPLPELPAPVAGYACRFGCVVLTLDPAQWARLQRLWPGLAGGFWMPDANGRIVCLRPQSAPDVVADADDWVLVRFDVLVEA